MLDKLHEGHQGVVRCRSRAQSSVWWPGLSRQLEALVRSCTACAVERCNPSEPMIASDTVLRPRQKVGTDMFVYKQATYLLVVDNASSYVEIAKLAETRLRGLPGKKALYTSLAAHVTLIVMAKRNVLCRPLRQC